MADVFPFAGYRYHCDKIEDLNRVVTPPYDKISAEDHKKYLRESPFNIARLILGEDQVLLNEENNYMKSAGYLEEWIDNGVIIKDQDPVYYAYCQEYEINGEQKFRKGFVGLGQIEEDERVKAHEETMEGPKADRLRLLKATETNFGHIFMLYSDTQKKILDAINSIIEKQSPLLSVNDRDDNLHQLWKIEDEELQKLIKNQMKDKNLYIADGHHRYQTALNFKNICEQNGYSGDFDRRMMTFINLKDPGLTILATHRLLYNLKNFKPDEFMESVNKDFQVQEFATKEEMYGKMDRDQGNKHTFGFCARNYDKFHTLTLKEEQLMDKLITNKSEAWKKLDVSILHKALLEKYLGIDEQALEEKRNVEYVRYRDQALNRLQDEKYQAAFLLNPTGVEEVKEVADKGEKMPQKSTDFYPKLLTGLVLHKLNINKPKS